MFYNQKIRIQHFIFIIFFCFSSDCISMNELTKYNDFFYDFQKKDYKINSPFNLTIFENLSDLIVSFNHPQKNTKIIKSKKHMIETLEHPFTQKGEMQFIKIKNKIQKNKSKLISLDDSIMIFYLYFKAGLTPSKMSKLFKKNIFKNEKTVYFYTNNIYKVANTIEYLK